jgi:hypothetical protein
VNLLPESNPRKRQETDLNGWSIVSCPSCGALVNEWLSEDGPDTVEYEECPMCAEDFTEEAWWA